MPTTTNTTPGIDLPPLGHTEDLFPHDFVGRVLASPSRIAARERIDSMTGAECVAAMRRGELAYAELTYWSSSRPGEVPLIGNEYEWIAAKDPAYIDGDR